MKATTRAETTGTAARRPRPGSAVALSALLLAASVARGQTAVEEIERPEGRVAGRLEGDARSGFRFVPSDGGAPIPMEPGRIVHREPGVAAADGPSRAGPPPFHLLAGEAARISGMLREVSTSRVQFSPVWQTAAVAVPRACVQAIVQRPGEARVLADSFEAIDPRRWSVTGRPMIVDRPRLDQEHGLRLTEGAALSHDLEEPLAAGRLELAFYDDGVVVPGRECLVEPVFRGPTGEAAIRIIVGWSEESLAVESTDGPTLPVQRLARSPGWHRLTVRFGPGETEIAVDGRELAHGREPAGPLCSIRLKTRTTEGAAAETRTPSTCLDDLRLIRFAEPPASLEIDPTQDEARLVVGDQIFGEVRRADGERIEMAVEGRPVPLRWSEVAGLYFRRVPAQGAPVEGLLVRAEWQAAAGDRSAAPDFAEGALLSLSDEALTIATPFAGTISVPRAALRRLSVTGRGRRVVLDVSAHHLGDEFSVTQPLDPPQFEAVTLERPLELAEVPERPAEVVVDVVWVQPEAGDSVYSAQVRKGELRTFVAVNGRRLDYINRHIRMGNEIPERVRIPIPPGLLRAGKNAVRIELTGTSEPHPKYDDLGVLQVAVEFPSGAADGGRRD